MSGRGAADAGLLERLHAALSRRRRGAQARGVRARREAGGAGGGAPGRRPRGGTARGAGEAPPDSGGPGHGARPSSRHHPGSRPPPAGPRLAMAEISRRLLVAGVTTRALAVVGRPRGVDRDGGGRLRRPRSSRVRAGDRAPARGWRLRSLRGRRRRPERFPPMPRPTPPTSRTIPQRSRPSPRAAGCWAIPPPVLERVRDPIELMLALRRHGFETPETRARAPRAGAGTPRRWLLKPRRSGGGHGTSAWRPGRPVGRQQYLQERIAGTPGSVVFLADGRRALALGLSRQLVGERAFGASGFRYCGSLIGRGASSTRKRSCSGARARWRTP